MKYPKPSNNPLSFRVTPETVEVSIDKIIARDDIEEDGFFTKKYCDYLTGKLSGYITRVSISRIKPGFYKRVSKKWKHFIDDVPQIYINSLAREIRCGYRPVLHLYHNFNQDCVYDFVCPDDIAVFYAYSKLGINKPPVIILGSKRGIEESALSIKGFKRTGDSYIHFVYAVENINKEEFLSLLGPELNRDAIANLTKLEKYITSFKSEFRNFHAKGEAVVDYHQIVYSMLIQASQMLRSVKILMADNLNIQAATIARSLYELSINLYLIWLSPHQITQMVQIASVISENDWERECENEFNEHLSMKLNRTSAEQIKKAKLYQYKLVKSVIQKARLSPFGEAYYKHVYSFLSDIVHHDFSMAARYKNSLEHGDDIMYDEDVKESIVRIVESCISQVLICLADDIGINIAILLQNT